MIETGVDQAGAEAMQEHEIDSRQPDCRFEETIGQSQVRFICSAFLQSHLLNILQTHIDCLLNGYQQYFSSSLFMVNRDKRNNSIYEQTIQWRDRGE